MLVYLVPQYNPDVTGQLKQAMGLDPLPTNTSGWVATKRALTVRNVGWGWWVNHTGEMQHRHVARIEAKRKSKRAPTQVGTLKKHCKVLIAQQNMYTRLSRALCFLLNNLSFGVLENIKYEECFPLVAAG